MVVFANGMSEVNGERKEEEEDKLDAENGQKGEGEVPMVRIR
jgi:hypothetical protein